jgi:hypothetical protein
MAKTAEQKRTLHFSRVTVRKQIEEIWGRSAGDHVRD